jgi:hypothetical protein
MSMDPIHCDHCGGRFGIERLTTDQRSALCELHYYEEFVEERRMLQRVAEFYGRYPEANGAIKPHFMRVLESDDPSVRDAMLACVPFDQITLESKPVSLPKSAHSEFADVIDFLNHTSVDVPKRLEFVCQFIAEKNETLKRVACPQCRTGQLRVDSDLWNDFAAQHYPSITWLWPEWHSFDNDGTLHVKASGHHGGMHWNGENEPLARTSPDYAFWCWFVAQPKFHRLVDERELPAIREDWEKLGRPRWWQGGEIPD